MPVTFAEFQAAAPEIGGFARQRIEATGLSFVATTRSDGWPRASGWEVFLSDSSLYVGSMPAAVKVKDVRRDPRCCVITPLADKDDQSGEAKLFCHAREVDTVEEWERVRTAFRDQRGFDPLGDFGGSHLFEMRIASAAWSRVEGDEQFVITSWTERQPVRTRKRVGALGLPEEVT
ncbi:MAG: pyridoxamine 5'-phosphate oxidase family protein [Actinomycetota bacterium]|nr:pyridoxamine 5'-phosphate oxidase family protein [Actinomycetota bacterium]